MGRAFFARSPRRARGGNLSADRSLMLSPGQRAALEALAPAGAHPELPGLFDAGFEEFYAQFQREAAPLLRLAFEAALWTAVWLAPLLIGRLPPITRLEPLARERALEAIFSHRFYWLRQLGLVLKAVPSFCYGADPRVRHVVGYPLASS